VADQRLRFADNDPLLFSRNKIKEAELDGKLAVATQVVAEHETRSEHVLAGSRIQLATLARDRAEQALGRAKSALTSMEIRAPSDGILVLRRNDRGDVPKLGEQMYSGSTIAEIPLLDDMEAELFVLEVDGSGLELGQPADIVVESRPDLTFHGKIRLVDKLAKPRQQRVPVQYFSVVVALDQTSRDVMKPGQRVHAKLVLDAEHALVVPRQAVFERAGTSLVYRRTDHGYISVTVQLGAATAGLVVVRSGLDEGDVIAQRDPTLAADAEPAKGTP
jgi:multidrug efflux pump subunit AcrA (membrane-fusion protein)